MSLSAGVRLGPYEVLGLLGAGGMGEVYRARDTRLGREVAITVLPAERMSDEDRRRRFVQEARAASALNHPNIVTIYEIESANGVDYIVMELIAGQTLRTLIPRQGRTLADVLRIAIPLADALGAAHAAGIVHRDVRRCERSPPRRERWPGRDDGGDGSPGWRQPSSSWPWPRPGRCGSCGGRYFPHRAWSNSHLRGRPYVPASRPTGARLCSRRRERRGATGTSG